MSSMGGLTWDRQALWSKARDAVPPPPFLHLTSIVLQSSCGARPGEPESPISQLDTTVVASPWGFFPMELHLPLPCLLSSEQDRPWAPVQLFSPFHAWPVTTLPHLAPQGPPGQRSCMLFYGWTPNGRTRPAGPGWRRCDPSSIVGQQTAGECLGICVR